MQGLAQAGASPGSGGGLSTRPLAPAWVVLPLAVVTLLAVSAHVRAMHVASDMPRSRRRIRVVNAGVMLVTVPVLAYAMGIATPARSAGFALAWSASALLLTLIVAVAMVDVANTWRLHGGERGRVNEQIKALRLAMRREVERRRAEGGGDGRAETGPGGGPSSDPPPERPSSGSGDQRR